MGVHYCNLTVYEQQQHCWLQQVACIEFLFAANQEQVNLQVKLQVQTTEKMFHFLVHLFLNEQRQHLVQGDSHTCFLLTDKSKGKYNRKVRVRYIPVKVKGRGEDLNGTCHEILEAYQEQQRLINLIQQVATKTSPQTSHHINVILWKKTRKRNANINNKLR